jgi:hypothetical protein
VDTRIKKLENNPQADDKEISKWLESAKKYLGKARDKGTDPFNQAKLDLYEIVLQIYMQDPQFSPGNSRLRDSERMLFLERLQQLDIRFSALEQFQRPVHAFQDMLLKWQYQLGDND